MTPEQRAAFSNLIDAAQNARSSLAVAVENATCTLYETRAECVANVQNHIGIKHLDAALERARKAMGVVP